MYERTNLRKVEPTLGFHVVQESSDGRPTELEGIEAAIRKDPAQILPLLGDQAFLKRVYEEFAVKVTIDQQEIHAPAASPRARDRGKGKTLCGTTGIRGPNVTCGRCMRSLEKGVSR